MQYTCERLTDGWSVALPDGGSVLWRGMNTGPLVWSADEVDELCRSLLGVEAELAERLAEVELLPVPCALAGSPALVLHSTAPEKRTFEGELAALAQGRSPYDSTTHAEARATLFARAGDLMVGRTAPWRDAVASAGFTGVALPDADHYYLSHALLDLAARRPSALAQIVEFVRSRPRVVVRLYSLERGMLVFLLWLRRAAGVPTLFVDANRPSVTRVWNRKSILYPTVEAAAALPGISDPWRMLASESAASPLAAILGAVVPILPGYTVVRDGHDLPGFTREVLRAAQLLRARYGLRRGCLKACVAGGGMHITPNIALADDDTLAHLAGAAYSQGDDQVLEAHVSYDTTMVGERSIALAPSAHIRGGQVAAGITLQLTRGSTWIGNVFFDESTAGELGVSPAIYRRIDAAMHDLHRGFERVGGLRIAGIDFSVGAIGGAFGDEPLLAAQDPNLSFNGAECLRAFLERAESTHARHGATLVIRPAPHVTLGTLRDACRRRTADAEAIAIVPDRSGLLALHGERPREVTERLFALAAELQAAGLLLA